MDSFATIPYGRSVRKRSRCADAQWAATLAMDACDQPATNAGPNPEAEAALVAKLDALKAVELAGVITARESQERAAAFRAEHERAKAGHLPSDPASILAHAEALQAALLEAATDALREALRGVLGSVRVAPVRDDGAPYLAAHFKGGDAALLTWLAIGSDASDDPISTLVAGARSLLSLRNTGCPWRLEIQQFSEGHFL